MFSSSSQTPKISVIAIAYNLEKYIEKCINSLINQTLREIEIVIVDDGSIDATLNKINNIAKQDNRIKILSQKNQGPNTARENGLKIATGKYIQYVDGDDWLVLNACEKLYNQAEKELADVVVFHYQEIYPKQKTRNCYGYNKKLLGTNLFMAIANGNLLPSLCTKLIRRQFILDCDLEFPKNITYGEDLALSALLCLQQPKLSFVNEFLYCYYQRTGSAHYSSQGYFNDCEKIFSTIKNQIDKHSLSSDLQECFDFYCLTHLNSMHLKALKNKDTIMTQKIVQKTLDKKIVVTRNLTHKSLIHYIIFNIYNYQPKILFWINQLRILLRYH